MARADYYDADGYYQYADDDYGDREAAPREAPAPEQPRTGGMTIVGWAPSGSSWIPVYKGGDGQYYTGSGDNFQPWNGDRGSLKTGDGEAGKPTWAPGQAEPGNASQTYQESVAASNAAARAGASGSRSGSGGGRSGGGSSRGGGIDPSYLMPWTEQFRPPSDAGLPQYTPPPDFTYQDFQAPADFKPPTAEDILKDPSYLWRRDQIVGSLENSAAARGLLGSSGTLYDIGSAAGNFASQEYGNIFDRNFNMYADDWNRELTTYNTNRNNAVDKYATNYGVDKDTHNILTNRSKDVYQRAWDVFNDRRETFYKNQDRPADKLFRAMDIGSRAAAI